MTRFVSFVLLCPLAFTLPALAVTITSPDNNAQVSSPISLVASSSTCNSVPVTAMGYSLDGDSDTTIVDQAGIHADIPASDGKHTIHVKAWNEKGSVCVEDVTVDVSSAGSASPQANSAMVAPAATAAATQASGQGITISSPYNGTSHTSPFTLTASAPTCQGKTVSSMGYSLDNSSNTTIVHERTLGATITAGTGQHTVHVKAWGSGGASCMIGVTFTITGSSQGATTSSGGITVSSPENGSSVESPFALVAKASSCKGQAVSSLGYSLDNSSNTTILNGTSVDTHVPASSGAHVLHVKAWGKSGASCTMDNVSITVAGTAATSASVAAPSSAKKNTNIQTLASWTVAHDTGANGSASGSTAIVTSPTLSGHARKYIAHYSSNGAERFSKSFADDRTSTNFLYDAWVYISSSSSSIANIEMDLNQTMTSGNTLILGFQCDGWKGKWDYSENTGTPTKPVGKWVSTSIGCNPASWSRNKWHHVQIAFSRGTSSGNVTYKSVTLDGTTHTINKTAFAARAMGWGSSIVTNFQIDGRGSGTATVYVDKMNVSRW